MAMVPVRNIDIQNSEFLDILNEYKDVLLERETPDSDPLVTNLRVSCVNENADDWVGDKFMNATMSKGESHDGFPPSMRGFVGLKFDDMKDALDEKTKRLKEASNTLNSKLITFLSARNNALNACYPPGGYIGWHNNANAPGFNIIITYSETGDGWFDYYDQDKKERVRVQDVQGWQAKMTYFGPYSEPDKLVYHAAYSDCYRITVAFVFAEADDFWTEVIEDIETPC
jgi:hypothetical protein